MSHDPLSQYASPAFISGTQTPIPLLGTDISVRVLGGLAIVRTERRFKNSEKVSIEATMTFPVPVHATLVGLQARIGERMLSAAAKRKRQAREDYEAAIDAGKTAILHEEALRGIHLLNVGHVPPGQEISVVGTWALPLSSRSAGVAGLRIPTTVGDVYGRSPLADCDAMVHADVVHEATLTASSDGGFISVDGHDISGGSATIRLDHPIDIVVSSWSPRTLVGSSADGRKVNLIVSPAPISAEDLDIALLFDRSGSMDQSASGDSDRSANRQTKHSVALLGLRQACKGLLPGDTIAVWQFDTSVEKIGRAKGASAVGTLVGGLGLPRGGTNVGAAISCVLADEETRDVLLVTDGKSYDLDIQKAAQSGRRFSVVLIGEDSLEAGVGHLAALTGGEIFIAHPSNSGEAIQSAIASLRRAKAQQGKIVGSPAHVETLMSGMSVSASWAETQDAQATVVDDADARVVGAVAASLAIPFMDEDAATDLAEANGICCHLTSLILVDEEGEVQEGLPEQRKIALMSPRTVNMAYAASASAMGVTFSAASAGSHDSFYANASFGAVSRGMSAGRMSKDLSVGGHVGDAAIGLWKLTPGVPSVHDILGDERGRPRAIVKSPSLSKESGLLLDDLQRIAQTTGFVVPHMSFAPTSLARYKGQIAWSNHVEELRSGKVGSLGLDLRSALVAAASLSEIAALATALKIAPIAVVIGLLAKAEASADRYAARVYRAVLGRADTAMVEAASRVLGL